MLWVIKNRVHFILQRRRREVLCRSSSRRKAFACWKVPLWISSSSLLVTATLLILRDGWFLEHTPETKFPNSYQQCSKGCSRVGLRCSWGTFPVLVGLSPVFSFRCSQFYSLMCLHRTGSKRLLFSREVSEENAPFLSIPFWGWEVKCGKLEVPAKPSPDSSFKLKGSFRWQVAL